MAFSPSKHKTLSRQTSSPSLAVGLPPTLPESTIMTPSSSSRNLKRSRSRKIHRGDVESSAASATESEDDRVPGWVLPTTPVKSVISANVTPKPKVVGMMDGVHVPKSAQKKRGTLQERLQAAAKLKKADSGTFSRKVSSSSESEMVIDGPVARYEGNMSQMNSGAISGKDKVVVCVRLKPTTSSFASTAYDLSSSTLTLSDSHPSVMKRGGKAGREEEYIYAFDALLQQPGKTHELYASKVAPLVDKAMNGFNSTIFAYGQTGSGKSYTMTGTSDELGIIPCAVDGVFDAINSEPDRAFLLRVSYIEIYNETLRDLLSFKQGPLQDSEKPTIRSHKGKIHVEPLVEEIVSTPQDIVDLLERGNNGRKVGATDWNERSSRSHCVFTITIESKPRDGDGDDDIRMSRLSLIDLAGSEKGVTDLERRGEGKHINRSLLALKTVINRLTDKKSGHVPYRDSKLTHLLENALGGDSNICVICTLSGEEEHAGETLETLKFAGACSQVETKATKNVLQSSERALIKAKDKEIEFLKKRLQAIADENTSQPTETVSNLADSVAAMEARKTKLTAQLAKLNNEILTSELPRSTSGLPLSPPKPKRRRISDFTALMPDAGRIGLGIPSKLIKGERRAVSNMIRLNEGEELPSLGSAVGSQEKGFEHERTIATLRRALGAKQAELDLKQKELSTALAGGSERPSQSDEAEALRSQVLALTESHQALQESAVATETQHENTLRELHVQLEATRSELVATISDKQTKIDDLESAILDLRKSREDLAIDDQQAVDDIKAQLDQAQRDLSTARADRQSAWRELELIREHHSKEFARYKSEYDEASRPRDDLSNRYHEKEREIITLKDELKSLRDHGMLNDDSETLRQEKEEAISQRDKAVAELDHFQKAAISAESTLVAELRAELASLRKAKEDEAAAANEAINALTASIETSNNQIGELQSTIDAAKSELDQERNRANDVSTKFQSGEDNLKAKDEQISQLSSALEEDKRKIEEAGRSTKEMQDALDAAVAQAAAVQAAALQSKEEELVEATRLLKENQERIQALEQSLREKDENNRNITSELENQKQSMDTVVKSTRDELQQIINVARQEAEAAHTSLEEEKRRGEEASKRVSDLEGELQEKENAATQMASQLEQAKADGEMATKSASDGLQLQQALEAAQAETTKAQSLLDMEKESHKETTTKLEVSETKLKETNVELERLAEELRKARESGEETLVSLRRELDTTREESNNTIMSLRKELETSIASSQAASTAAQDLLKEEQAKTIQALDRIKELENLVSASDAKLQQLQAELQSSKDQASQMDDQNAKFKELERELESSKKHAAELDGRVAKFQEMETELQNSKLLAAGLTDQVAKRQQLETDLESSKQRATELEGQVAKLQQLEIDFQRSHRRASELEGQVSGMRQLETELQNSKLQLAQLREQIKQSGNDSSAIQEVLEAERARLEKAMSAKYELESTLKKKDKEMEEVSRQVESLGARHADQSKRVESLEQQLKEVTSARDAALRDLEGLRTDTSKFEASRVDLQNQLKAAKGALDAANAKAVQLSKELERIKSQMTASTEEMEKMKIDLQTTHSRADSLAKEVLDLKAAAPSSSTPTRARHSTTSSLPSSNSATLLANLRQQALRNTATGTDGSATDRLKTKEGEEIDRLEKVVDAQRVIIDDQREKIKFWANELEKQREVVRLLTHADLKGSPKANDTPTRSSPRHGKSQSLSITNTPGSKTTKTNLPNSFTAYNLALPTSPTPLPMHTGQFANTTTRKGRRLTIEHDIDLLQESSKVNRARELFDIQSASPSPEKKLVPQLEKRGATASLISRPLGNTPRQRRP